MPMKKLIEDPMTVAEEKQEQNKLVLQEWFVWALVVSFLYSFISTIDNLKPGEEGTIARSFAINFPWLALFPWLPWNWQTFELMRLEAVNFKENMGITFFEWSSTIVFGYGWSFLASSESHIHNLHAILSYSLQAFFVVQLSRHLKTHLWFFLVTMLTAIGTAFQDFGGLDNAYTWLVLWFWLILLSLHCLLPSYDQNHSRVFLYGDADIKAWSAKTGTDGFTSSIDAVHCKV